MKKRVNIIWIITLAVGVGLLSSCNDFFQVDPANGLKEEDHYRNRNDLNAGAFGIYAALAPEVHKFLLWGSARADMVTTGAEGADAYVTEFVNNKVTALNPYTDYSGLYKAIARCNRQLEYIAKVQKEDRTMKESDFSAYYGEAYYMRALCYFYLVRTYKEFPLLLEDISEDVTYKDENGNTIQMNTLNLSEEELRAVALQPQSEQKVWEQIISDSKKAMGMLKRDGAGTNYNWNGVGELPVEQKYGRATLPAAFALSCEVAMWTGRFDQAAAYADLVVNAAGYGVGDSESWGGQFFNRWASPFSMFLLGYVYDGSQETNRLQEFTSPYETDGGHYLLKPVKPVVDHIFSETSDSRIASSYKRINKQDMIWKYIGKDNKVAMRTPYHSDASWHVTRTADILLWKGIIENHLGNADGALYFLNQIRAQRNLDEYNKEEISMAVEDLDDMLFLERARELAFEGKRWYDLLFMAKVLNRPDVLPATVSQKYSQGERAAAYTWLQDQNNWYLPIEPERWK